MRIKAAATNNGTGSSQLNAFANFLLTIGKGKHVDEPNTKYGDEILLPKDIASNLDEAFDMTFDMTFFSIIYSKYVVWVW